MPEPVVVPLPRAGHGRLGLSTEWDGDRLIIISAFWCAVVQAKQINLSG
jgi:hypothetical protein